MSGINDTKGLGRLFYCSGLLEESVAKVYNNIAMILDNGLIRCLFRFIASDTEKHAKFFKAVCEFLNAGMMVNFKECGEVWGGKWKTIMADAEKFIGKTKISSEELISLINGLERLEGVVAEEYLTIMHIMMIELIAEERKIDLDYCKKILEWIIEDEKRHEQIIKYIKNLLTKDPSVIVNQFNP